MVLQWLHSQGCPWNVGVSLAVAKLGHLEMLRWVAEAGCPINRNVVSAAAIAGQPKVLEWLHARYGHESWWPEDKILASWANIKLANSRVDGLNIQAGVPNIAELVE